MDNTAQYLRELTGIEDLSMVESLSLIIDVSTQSLDQLSMLLPNLKVLNVSHSEVTILDISSAFLICASLSSMSASSATLLAFSCYQI